MFFAGYIFLKNLNQMLARGILMCGPFKGRAHVVPDGWRQNPENLTHQGFPLNTGHRMV